MGLNGASAQQRPDVEAALVPTGESGTWRVQVHSALMPSDLIYLSFIVVFG